MENPVAVAGFARALPEQAAELKELLISLALRARREEGCLEYHVHQDVDDSDLLFFYEVWRTAQDLDNHLAQPHMREFMAGRMTYLRQDIDVRVLGMQSPHPDLAR
ncbi:putative quinol monooxygenase [Kitasatospora sp. NPDC005856]|uniref:putative quinol monooxygenase n=1 Tax=Kitasatospora sp. NPDC005856 TaxID=3154566 RepID=UPI0033E36C5A